MISTFLVLQGNYGQYVCARGVHAGILVSVCRAPYLNCRCNAVVEISLKSSQTATQQPVRQFKPLLTSTAAAERSSVSGNILCPDHHSVASNANTNLLVAYMLPQLNSDKELSNS